MAQSENTNDTVCHDPEFRQDRDVGHLIDSRPTWMCEAEQYVSWFDGVERTIIMLLKRVDIKIDPGHTPQGTHTFHENMLRVLGDPKNFYYEALGYRQVRHPLWQAKNFRNKWRNNGITKSRSACQGDLMFITTHKKVVEDGLFKAFGILGTRYPPVRKAFNENMALRTEALERCLADREKTTQAVVARDRFTLEQERETYNEHVRIVEADLDKRSAKLKEDKGTHEIVVQAHRTLEEELKESKAADSRVATERIENAKKVESRFLELQKELGTTTADLKRLQDKAAAAKNSADRL